jgi:vang-like
MVKQAAPLLRSNIPQTAIVAALDTYDFVIVYWLRLFQCTLLINVIFCMFQDEHWGENTTAVTMNSDMDYTDSGAQFGLPNGNNPGMGPNPAGTELDKWRLETERGMGFRCRRHAGPLVAVFLSMLAFISPILMAGLPKLGLFGLRSSQLQCGVECDGMLVSLAFKLFTLVVGTWGVFFRNPRSTLPRIHVYRALVCLLILVFLISFWLFYASHILNETISVEYSGLVQFALHLVDALLFVHYLAIILMELRHTQPQYYVKVLRSPDGESKGFPIGQLSVQRAAAWILDRYYTDFPIYNPYLDRLTGARNRKGIKVYDIDGNANVSTKNITVLLTLLWTVMILLCLFQESKNIIFTCGDSKSHSWPSPLCPH